jgi:hypothetical protein
MWRSLAAHLLWDEMQFSAVLTPVDRGHEHTTMSAVLEIRCTGITAQDVFSRKLDRKVHQLPIERELPTSRTNRCDLATRTFASDSPVHELTDDRHCGSGAPSQSAPSPARRPIHHRSL